MTTVKKIADQTPDKPAVIYGNQESVESYGELELRSRRVAAALRAAGLEHGDCVAVLLANDDVFFDVFWACHRIGLYFTPINWHLQRDEVAYIIDNCDAKIFLSHARFATLAQEASAHSERLVKRVSVDGEIDGFVRLEALLGDVARDPEIGEELEGTTMLYSSGTTGQPKGVRRPLPKVPAGDPLFNINSIGLTRLFGMTADDTYLCPAPLYHAAPLVYTSGQMRLGATSVVMRQFDPEEALRLIESHHVTTSQWVPTHFRRLVRLPDEIRNRYDVSSLRVAVHAAAPCPIPLKQQMIDWWGDAIVEYYAGTEGGGTIIRADEWLEHKGSVGRHWANGGIHIIGEDGEQIHEPFVDGAVYFDAPQQEAQRFQYYKDDAKTAKSYLGNRFTLGDVGHLDADGFLYLTDRQSHMIISGGVNVYPQETENCLSMHPKVEDVAVIGVPNEEMGEEVKAVVVPVDAEQAGPALAQELIDHCREHIAHFKCPRSVDFVDALPRTETGKMAKRKLRDRYESGAAS